MKSNITQRKFKAVKASSCSMCKPNKKGWQDKRTVTDKRKAVGADQQMREL